MGATNANPYGSFLIHIDHMDLNGSIWIQMDPYGSIWIHVDPYGSLWIHLDLYGSAFENSNEYICCLRDIASTVRKYSMEYIYGCVLIHLDP